MERSTYPLGMAGLGLLLAVTEVAAASLAPGQGVRLLQQEFNTATGMRRDTRTGFVEVDLPRLRQSTGLAAGYLNMATPQGWLVRNVPLPAEDSYPYAKLKVSFDTGSTSWLSSIAASLSYSEASLDTYAHGDAHTYELATLTVSLGGAGTDVIVGAPAPPTFTDVLLGDPADNDTVIQFDHPNIEAADNACMPTAVANSLQFLENTQSLPVPHDHKPGLTPDRSAGDTSLVGQLEKAMGRQVTDRRHGEGTWGLQGKLKYLAGNGLAHRVQVRHWGAGGPGASNGNPDSGTGEVSVTVGGTTLTSKGSGGKPSFDELLEAMRDGQNCEAVYAWPGGRHAVDLVGVGKHRGQPWLVHASDQDQDSDSDGAGPTGLVFETLKDTDGDGLLNLSGSDRYLETVICEKALPPPATVTVVAVDDPRGHTCCVPPPPPQLSVDRQGNRLRLIPVNSGSQGAVSWLPLAGTVAADGRFDLVSRATVAGRPDVDSRFVGTYDGRVYEGELTIGTEGELLGVPLKYRLRITEAGPQAAQPAMRVNGYRRSVALRAADAVKVSLSLKAAALAGQAGDWWLVVMAPDGQWYHFDLASQAWQPGLAPTYSGALFDIGYFGLPTLAGLPTGTYSFFFGFDTAANGVLDIGSAVYENTVVTVQP